MPLTFSELHEDYILVGKGLILGLWLLRDDFDSCDGVLWFFFGRETTGLSDLRIERVQESLRLPNEVCVEKGDKEERHHDQSDLGRSNDNRGPSRRPSPDLLLRSRRSPRRRSEASHRSVMISLSKCSSLSVDWVACSFGSAFNGHGQNVRGLAIVGSRFELVRALA